MTTRDKVEARFYWAMRLVLAGLIVELLSLFGLHHPMGFMIFAAVGCSLMVLGILLFLTTMLSLVRAPESEGSE